LYNAPTPNRWNWDWDGRHKFFLNYVSSEPPIVPVGQRVITLVRHSQYNRVQGEVNDDKTLTSLGEEQAKLTGQRLKELGVKFDAIFTSQFVRAQRTAQIITNELELNDTAELQFDADLNEGLATMMEPFLSYRSAEQFTEEIERTAPAIKRAFHRYFHRRGEAAMHPRSDSGDANILIIGHGNVFRYYLARALQLDTAAWARMSLLNCSISRVRIFDDGRVQVTHIGDTGHLPPEMLTNNLSKMK